MRYVDKDFDIDIVKDTQRLLSKAKTYNSSENVRDKLRMIYSGCCAYCESSFEEGSYFQIDHFYPKHLKKYRLFAKDIRNLHYSCQRCNNLKGSKCREVLSPNWYLDGTQWKLTRKEKINNEIYYVGHLLYSRNLSEGSLNRGENTISVFNLNNDNAAIRGNRSYLVESRLRVCNNVHLSLKSITDLLINYNKSSNCVIDILFSQVVSAMHPSSCYSTMIIQNYGDMLMKLLKTYIKLKARSNNASLRAPSATETSVFRRSCHSSSNTSSPNSWKSSPG